jgi:hypothetical protein
MVKVLNTIQTPQCPIDHNIKLNLRPSPSFILIIICMVHRSSHLNIKINLVNLFSIQLRHMDIMSVSLNHKHNRQRCIINSSHNRNHSRRINTNTNININHDHSLRINTNLNNNHNRNRSHNNKHSH